MYNQSTCTNLDQSILTHCTEYLLMCCKTLLQFGPPGLRVSFKYTTCKNCSGTIAHVLLSHTYSSHCNITGHLNSHSLVQLKVKLQYYISLIIDQYLFDQQSD